MDENKLFPEYEGEYLIMWADGSARLTNSEVLVAVASENDPSATVVDVSDEEDMQYHLYNPVML